MNLLISLLPSSVVEKKYVHAGAVVGEAVSYLYLGEFLGFMTLLNNWVKWEEEYARRGFRTISLDHFITMGGYDESIDELIGQKRGEGEKPVYYAKMYRSVYLENFEKNGPLKISENSKRENS